MNNNFRVWHNLTNEVLTSLSNKKIDTKQVSMLLEKDSCFKLLRVFPRLNKFYLFNIDCGIYNEFNSNEMKFLINTLLRELPIETTITHVTQILQYFSCGLLCSTGLPQFDQHVIVFQNGTFDFRSGQFRPWSPEDFVIGKVPYAYDPEATCPQIRKFLYEFAHGYQDRVNFLLCWSWATLRGNTGIQAFLYLTGPGGSGKSVFVQLLSGLVGKHSVITTSLRLLKSDPFEVLNISGKKFISVVDAEFYKGDISILKALTGGDTLIGRTKFTQGATEVKAQGLVTLVGNFPIGSLDSSGGLRRRMRLFLADQVAANEDTQLMHESSEGYGGKFVLELPGFFNWVNTMQEKEVRSSLSQRYIPSQTEVWEHQDYQANPLLRWAKEELEVGSGLYLGCKRASGLRQETELSLRKPLYPAYERWSKREGVRTISAKQFSSWILDVLLKAGFSVAKVRKPAGYFIEGIRLMDAV
jgi:putative DNA primase/helicase